MKKFIALLISIFFSTSLYAAIDEIIFFGDSLSDNGNLYKVLQVAPKSPPYFQGRFSNGPTWAEHVGKYYYDRAFVNSKNFAYGGSTAAMHNPLYNPPIVPVLLEAEVNGYLLESMFKDKQKTLYSIWTGGNDYVFNTQPDIDDLTQRVVDKISQAISTLILFGGKTFLVFNLPDLASGPTIDVINSRARLHSLALMHNQKLDAAIQEIKIKHPDVKIVFIDAYALLNDMTVNLDKYNEKYHVHLTNLTEACWKGLPLFKAKPLLSADFKKSLPKNISSTQVSDYMTHTPALAATLRVNQAYEDGGQPCANANEYLFWDMMHPSAVTHEIIAAVVIERLTAEGLA